MNLGLQQASSWFDGKREAITRYLSSTLALVSSIVAHTVGLVLLARALGPEQFGQLAVISSVANVGLAMCGLGGAEAMRRLVARSTEEHSRAFGHALVLLVATCTVVSLLLSVVLALWIPVAKGALSNFFVMLLLVSSSIGLFAWLVLVENVLLAHGNVARANLVNIGAGVGRALTAVLACLVFGVTDLASWAVWNFAFYSLASMAGIAAIWSYGRPQFKVIRGELANGATMTATGLLSAIRQNADVLALSAVASPAVIGIYSVARRIVSTASVISASFDRLIYSSLARAGQSGATAVARLALRYARYSLALCIAASIALWLFAPLLPMIFGAVYADAVWLMRLMSFMLLLTGMHYLAFDALNAAEQHKPRLLAEVGAGLIGLGVLAGAAAYGTLEAIIAAGYIASSLVVIALWGTLWKLARENDQAVAPRPVGPAAHLARADLGGSPAGSDPLRGNPVDPPWPVVPVKSSAASTPHR